MVKAIKSLKLRIQRMRSGLAVMLLALLVS